MAKIPSSKFSLKSFYIKESHIVRDIDIKPKSTSIDIAPSAIINSEKNTFELQLEINLKEKNGSLDVKVVAIGLFLFKSDIENIDNYFYLNAPAIIFPYVRAYIATITGLNGASAIHLPLLNVASLMGELKANTKQS